MIVLFNQVIRSHFPCDFSFHLFNGRIGDGTNVCPILSMIQEYGKDSIAPAPAGAQRKIACATFDVTDFCVDKKFLVFKRENCFCC